MARIRRRLIVSGRVQGVWFRETCRREATRLGVSGSVSNRHDGSVEVIAEGESAAVRRLIEWCRSGPPRAQVTGVEIAEEPLEGLDSFRVG